MRLDLRVEGMNRLLKRIRPADMDVAIRTGLNRVSLDLQRWIIENRMSARRSGKKGSRKLNDDILGVITGRLRASIAVYGKNPAKIKPPRTYNVPSFKGSPINKVGAAYQARIGTNVEYAATHEFGRDNIKARPFLRPAVEDSANEKRAVAIMRKYLQKVVEK